MSVLVKEMWMPKDCRECRLMEYNSNLGETWCAPAVGLLAVNFKPIPFDGRPNWCPLVELPEKHGRLIDADALVMEMINGIRAGNLEDGYEKYQNINNMDDCVECVKYADVVIEAEGVEE